jgi:glycosyltransferase involved in cell wall biosynthesis
VIVVTNATELMQALLVRWVSGAKIVLSAEDTKLPVSRIGPVRRCFKRILLKRADMYCAHSSAARELLLTYGVPVGKIISTPWAVDNEQFARWAAETNAAEQRRKLDVDGVVFVTVGSLIPRKGIDQLLLAFHMIPAELRAKGSILIVGDGPERHRLTELAKAQGLTNVRFVGHLSPREVAACLAAGDIFVLPTLEDVWGLVIGEAMAAGLPILCSKYAGGGQDLVREGVNGRVFDPLNHAQLSASLRDVLEHPEQLREMGKRSREIIAGFTIDGSISSLAEGLRASVER